MKIFNNIIERLKGKKKLSFKSLLNKLKHIFKLRSWQIKVSLTVFVIVIGSGLFLVYGQSGSTSSAPSLTKGLIAHYTMDADDYEEGTVNLANTERSRTMALHDGSASALFEDAPERGSDWKKVTIIARGSNHRIAKFPYIIHPTDTTRTYSVEIDFANTSGYYIAGDGFIGGSVSNGNISGKRFITYTTTINSGSLSIFLDHRTTLTTGLNDVIYYRHYQVEEKSYATPFVNGARQDHVVDKTSYSNHGINYGAISAIDRNGKEGGVMSFDGIDDRVSINYTNPVEKTSVFAWFKRNGSPAGGYHIITGGAAVELSIPDSSGQVRTGVTTTTQGRQVFNSGSGLCDGNWHLVGMTYDGSTLKSYIDGKVTTTNSVSGNLVGTATEIGRFLSNSYAANGLIDDVRFYNRALSEEEALLLFNSYEPKAQISSINSGLIAYWPLNKDNYNQSDERVTDSSAYSNHGTNYGATPVNDRLGKSGGAFNFNSSTASIQTNFISNKHLNNGDDFTLSTWIRINTYPADSYSRTGIVGCNSWNSGGFGFQIDESGIKMVAASFDSTAEIRAPIANFPLNVWHHLTFSYKKGLMTMYKNGEIIVQGSLDTWSTNNLKFLIGYGTQGGWNRSFKGDISETRIYNRALSQDEALLLFNSYSPQSGGDTLQKGLVLDMPLTSEYTKGGSSGSEVMTDKTPYSKDGQNYGANITNEDIVFNGSSAYIKLPNEIVSTNQIRFSGVTYSAWVKSNQVNIRQNIVGQKPHDGYSDFSSGGLVLESSKAMMVAYDDNGSYKRSIGKTNLNNGTWYHLVGTYNALDKNIRIYVNGELDGDPVLIYTFSRLLDNNTNTVGKQANSYFNGHISNLKIYNRDLSDEEVRSLYDRGKSDAGIIF